MEIGEKIMIEIKNKEDKALFIAFDRGFGGGGPLDKKIKDCIRHFLLNPPLGQIEKARRELGLIK